MCICVQGHTCAYMFVYVPVYMYTPGYVYTHVDEDIKITRGFAETQHPGLHSQRGRCRRERWSKESAPLTDFQMMLINAGPETTLRELLS